MEKHLRDERRVKGLCAQCGQSCPESYRCQDCRDYAKQKQKNYYEKRKATGKCVWPGCDNAPRPGRTYCETCSSKSGTAATKLRAAGLCVKCRQPAVPGTWLCENHRGKETTRAKRLRQDIRLEVMANYGGPVCVGCGETELEVLQMDHINGGGRKHVQSDGVKGKGLCRWLRDNGFPPGFRVLCANCNVRAHRKVPFPNDRKPESSQ